MEIGFVLALAAGVLLGNWIFLPICNKEINRKSSFYIGLLAAVICLFLAILIGPFLP
jgi:hypothetical protein